MDTASLAPLDIQGMLSKDAAAAQPSPPPAYSPHPRVNLPAAAAAAAAARPSQHMASLLHQPVLMDRAPFASLIPPIPAPSDADEDDGDSDQGQSPICLRINTSVKISSNHNLVCINDTPADHANAIARAVVNAIQENSSGHCGIPMVDEDGRPRPVNIKVDAGLEVQGAGNIVGNENVINQVLARQWNRLRRQRDEPELHDHGHGHDAHPPSPPKRPRS
ncbi:uncharacterized protein UV8b_02099 [Ustilaginoidea virens]|uniref:Uncharacterized protein n=1 Tax=Ustilaginoidea virens TaxID=1159556 RepID=A0A063BST0_USTVR|nr:uncharacterized protein UV8b_02099 [Ustilaginoidea virens]QUC17858.1 hypothetical protein UV8b_02099 [Ustilaginoidea virens]GAO17801.1 hypothetical protein UVI_02049320 [Ustilaginoidea virens]